MARRRGSFLSSFRGFLYALARLIGDVQAVRRGPRAVAKRLARRAAWRAAGKVMRKILR
ncbi:hypothetical protein [Thermotoga caldifontis]|uniref:hypothetical protein n=1 Tax=Thermotoga caldifontis TaxID=1508419 RepID=UPI001494B0AC|nr:hypothetical protein [Thermotoga caldifontis]